MTKTKLKVNILRTGSENDYLTRIIASHNEGLSTIALNDFISWGVMRSALYPGVKVSIQRDADNENMVIVTDMGKTSMTIEEVIVYELENANDPDDIKNVL